MMNKLQKKYSKLSPAMKSSLHELYLDGIEVTEDMIDELILLDNDKITEEEFIKRAVDWALSKNN